jgi:hypothetical protein
MKLEGISLCTYEGSTADDLHAESDDKEDGRNLADPENIMLENLLGELMVLGSFPDSRTFESGVVGAWDQ